MSDDTPAAGNFEATAHGGCGEVSCCVAAGGGASVLEMGDKEAQRKRVETT